MTSRPASERHRNRVFLDCPGRYEPLGIFAFNVGQLTNVARPPLERVVRRPPVHGRKRPPLAGIGLDVRILKIVSKRPVTPRGSPRHRSGEGRPIRPRRIAGTCASGCRRAWRPRARDVVLVEAARGQRGVEHGVEVGAPADPDGHEAAAFQYLLEEVEYRRQLTVGITGCSR